MLHHDGLMSITGRAPDQLRFVRDGTELVDSRSADEQHAARELREQTSRRRAGKHRADAHEPCARRRPESSSRSASDGVIDPQDERTSVDRSQSATRNRFDDVVKLEHAKQALMQLGYKGRTARDALVEVSVHVDADAEIADLVEAVLERDRRTDGANRRDDVFALAKQALVQLGYPAAIAMRAVEAARAHVGERSDLQVVIKDALRRCAT
jgi:Holliday junction resolvasome RuvABC DNA-binding subunit